MNFDHVRRASFGDYKKWDLVVLKKKKKNRRLVRSAKIKKMSLIGFLVFPVTK